MSSMPSGWRSARSRRLAPDGALPAAAGQPAWPAPAPRPTPPPAPAARGRRLPVAPGAAGAAGAAGDNSLAGLWRLLVTGVEWTPVFVGFLAYMFTVVTRVVPIGDVSIAFCVVALLLQREKLRVPGFFIWMVALAAWGWVGYASTEYPMLVSERALGLVKLCVIVLVAANALRTPAQLRFFIVFFLGCFALFPLRGAYFNYYIYNHRPFGRAVWKFIYANPNDLAMLSALQLSMAAGLLAGQREKVLRLLALAGVGMVTLLIFMTQSRGAIIACSVFGIATLVYSKHNRLRTMLVAAAVGVVLMMFAPKKVWDRLEGLANLGNTENLRTVDKEGSAEQRFEIWKVARAIIREHPLMGVGVGAYPAAHNEFSQRPDFKRTARGFRDTHSTTLNVLAEMGYPGLFLFLGVFGSVALRAERIRRRARAVVPHLAQQLMFIELGLLAFFMAGLFGSYAHLAFAYVHLVLTWTFAEAVSAVAGGPRAPAAPASTFRRGRR